MNQVTLLQAAEDYFQAGLCVLPAIPKDKRPALDEWRTYRQKLPPPGNIPLWFDEHRAQALCLVTGSVSGHLEIIDFDCQGEAFPQWQAFVEAEQPELFRRLVIERSPSGGRHVLYRCTEKVDGSKHLARLKETVESASMVVRFGKTYMPRQNKDGRWYIKMVMIETRGEGAICLCAPSPGYEVLQGIITNMPVLSSQERMFLLSVAKRLDQYPPEPVDLQPPMTNERLRPGDDFNQRGNPIPTLEKHGWICVGGNPSGNQYWRRPGKQDGCSATLKDGVFYVFSENADPFVGGHAYSPFSVFTLLEHGGRFKDAAKELRTQGYGEALPASHEGNNWEAIQVDLNRFADTSMSQIKWIWPGVIPKGMTSLLAGKQGLGKSYLVCDLAARYSAGLGMPDSSIHESGSVLILTREDDASCVLLPRLHAAGADLRRVYWSIFSNHKTGHALDLVKHIDRLPIIIKEHGIDFLIIDTFAAFAPAGTDANSAQDVRQFLNSLNQLARQTGVAVLIVAHLRKTLGQQQSGEAMDEVSGSAQMTAGVRVASILTPGLRADERWFRVVKSNLGPINATGWVWRFNTIEKGEYGQNNGSRLDWSVAKGVEKAGHPNSKLIPVIEPEDVLRYLQEMVAKAPVKLRDATHRIWKHLKQDMPRVSIWDVQEVIQVLIEKESNCLLLVTGPRGMLQVCRDGVVHESASDLALRLACENPNITSRELQLQAKCRNSTAITAIRKAKMMRSENSLSLNSTGMHECFPP